jgi:signal transduction histidine kinase
VAFADHAAYALTSAALYQQLKLDSAARDHFFSMVNHDLKSPLANIKAQVDLLLRRIGRGKLALESDEGRAELTGRLEQISQRVRELGRQIDDLVDVSRIEAERFTVHLRREDLTEIVRSAVESLQILFPDREIRLELPDSPIWATVDSVRISQVINNLVTNAVKYSDPPSPVEVRLGRRAGAAFLEVTDQGYGIPEEEQHTLFQSYFRGANRRSNRGAGLGLGLYIVAGIVRAHEGRITVESQVGAGSTFTVLLPLAE